MCYICLEFNRGKLTAQEARRNASEVLPRNHEHLEDVYELTSDMDFDKERQDWEGPAGTGEEAEA